MDIQPPGVGDCGNFEMSMNERNRSKPVKEVAFCTKRIFVMFYYDPLVTSRPRVRRGSPQVPREYVPLFGRGRTNNGMSVLDTAWN